MKVPQPDLNKQAVDTFVARAGANRKLKRLWGTTTVKGVEVLHARRHYHKAAARPDNYETLFKYLKVYEDIKDYDGEGIKSAWFTLNKSNGDEETAPVSTYVRDNLNRMWWDNADGNMPSGLTLTTTIMIAEGFRNNGSVTGIDWEASDEDRAQYIRDNYESLWRSKKITQEGVGIINKGSYVDSQTDKTVQDEDDLSPDDPWLAILSRYALRANGVPCTIKSVEAGIGIGGSSVYSTIVVTLEIPHYSFYNTAPIVNTIRHEMSMTGFHDKYRGGRPSISSGFSSTNERLTQTQAKQVNYYETDEDVDADTVSRVYLQWENSASTVSNYASYWLQDGDVWYLKADVIDNPRNYGTTHVKLNKYIYSLLDTGYKKKKVPVWKKIVAVVVFIVAVVLTYLSFGALTGWTAPVMAAAYAVIVGALVISLVAALASALGANEWAMAFAWVSKTIEPLVMVASVILVIDIISQLATAIAEGGAMVIVDAVLTEVIGASFTNIAAGNISATAAIRMSNKAVSAYTKAQANKLEKLSDKNKDLKAEYDKIQEEISMESDVMKSYMNIYAKPATSDWSIYASTYDLPYERGGGVLAIGNVQRTTKQATRKADYKEPMFEGMFFV